MEYFHIDLDIRDKVATLTFNRPDVLNALNGRMLGEIDHALAQIVSNGARALVLTGAGRAFCAGADIPGMAAEGGNTNAHDDLFNGLLLKLRNLAVPIVTAVNGAAAGAGLGYALAGDIVVASRSAYFLLPFAKLGLVPDVGATWLLPRTIGLARATALMMLGERLNADDAERWGLVWKLCEPDDLAETARALALRLAAGPTKALKLTRDGLAQAQNMDLAACLKMEVRHQEMLSTSNDAQEGIAAMRERRAPNFTGS